MAGGGDAGYRELAYGELLAVSESLICGCKWLVVDEAKNRGVVRFSIATSSNGNRAWR